MSLIAVCADKGSPGVTTAALALAATWPRPIALAELDPSGGDLALRLTDPVGRYVLAARPSVLTWAAARLGSTAETVWGHCQTVAGLPVLRGMAGAEQAVGLAPLWPELAGQLQAVAGGDVLADLGRLLPDGPVLPVAAAADLVVVVAAGTVDGLVHARDRVRGLLETVHIGLSGVAVLVVASDRDGLQVCQAMRAVLARDRLPAHVAGFLAVDRAGVAALQGGDRSVRWSRSLLARTARQVAAVLAGQLPALQPVAAPASVAVPAGELR